MRRFIQAVAMAGAVAGPALAQDATQDVGAQLDAMTCEQFIALSAEDQLAVMLAMRAHVNGEPLPDEPLPDEPLPLGTEAEIGGADALGGDSGSLSSADPSEGTDQAVTDAPADGGAEAPDVIEDTAAAAAGEPSPEASTEESLPDGPAVDPKLTAMRTSCLGGPDAFAADAMRAAHADYE